MDRLRRILAKMSEESYKQRGGKDSPMAGSLLTRAAACVNCSRDSTIRGMREVGGLIVRREPSDTKASARFARSLDDQSSEV